MKIQQHDGVVVDAAGIPAGLRQASAGGRGVARGKGGAKCKGAAALPPPSLYRAPRGGTDPRRLNLQGGAAAKGVPLPSLPPLYIGGLGVAPDPRDPISRGGQGGDLPPKSSGAPPTPRVSNPRRRGRPMGGAPAH